MTDALWRQVQPYTMTSRERVDVLAWSIERICGEGIPGDIVECGVWKGGSMMAAAYSLIGCGDTGRDLWLYDTFDGMTTPGEHDFDYKGHRAADEMAIHPLVVARSSLEEVTAHIVSTGYPGGRVHYVVGDVADTIPGTVPERIALLRLDTDWYSSTRHELEHLWPLLSVGGTLIIDDYGFWRGCRKAVDEWNADRERPVVLNQIDSTGVYVIKGHE